MRAVGATPQGLVLLDDTILDAQCCADAQELNTSYMLERFEEIFADGYIDEHDTPAVMALLRHTRLEHAMNKDQCSLMKWARIHATKVTALVAGYRARAQQDRACREAAL